MTEQRSLFDLPAVRERRQSEAQRWYARVRPAIRQAYSGQHITTDEVHALFEKRPELRLPSHLHRNVLGKLFVDWDAATATGWRRSRRPEAHRNLLREWMIAA